MSQEVLAREIRGETLLLHPERALSWPAHRMLVVADTHFGKSSIFARHGIAVPAGTDELDRQRINALLQATGSERLLVLGDFLHGPVAPDSEVAVQLSEWLQRLRPVQLLLVTGNHDRTAATGWHSAADWEGDYLDEGPFRFAHEAAGATKPGGAYVFCGHIHPVVELAAFRKRRPRIPVFWERPESMVLPSFGFFTGGFRIGQNDGGRVFAAGPECVVELPWGVRPR